MLRDLRRTDVFQEARRLCAAVHRPGEDLISDLADLRLSADPARLLFTGTLVDDLDGPSVTRICEVDLITGTIEQRTSGPHSDRHARLSPDRRTIAFLSDRGRASDFQLYFLDPRTWTVTPGPTVDGWIEYAEWSPDGRRLLLGVAGHGADLSSGQGARQTAERDDGQPSWLPRVIGGPSDARRGRRAWICDVEAGRAWCASSGPENIWEADWCGDDRLVAVTSVGAEEGDWYGAGLSLVDLSSGAVTSLYTAAHQIALPSASPSGMAVAFVEGIASDRGFVAGDLRLCDPQHGACRILDTGGVDVSCVEWRTDGTLLVAGHRGLETVVLNIDASSGTARELWRDSITTTSGAYATVLGLAQPDDFAFVREGFFLPPHVATVKGGVLHAVRDADSGRREDDGYAEAVRWQAPDGLAMEGWLVCPKGERPHATILDVHGGPILHWRPYWLGRAPAVLLLLRRGHAIFLPNPRGSSGRGQAFASLVVGDIGGADTADFLSGIDHLVATGIADPLRLGVMGLSYGGYMTCWLTTQDTRFAAAISVGPATNHVSHHLVCNIPQFVRRFLRADYTDLGSAYYSRSPILHARASRTPTLLVSGALDRCTPAEEAIQFHNALRENGVASAVLVYPDEGHGVHGIPATIDFAARCVTWFEHHIPSAGADAAAIASPVVAIPNYHAGESDD